MELRAPARAEARRIESCCQNRLPTVATRAPGDMNPGMDTRERIIELVSRLQEARSNVQQLEAQLDALLPVRRPGRPPRVPAAAAVPVVGRLAGRRARAGSLASRVVELLESAPDETFRVPEVAARLGISNIRSLRATVMRLASRRKIRRQRRGRYQAVPAGGRRRAAQRP